MLKDIYSPLEIDDQWDQRAPSHEDKVEGGNADGMSSVTPEVPVENPSGGGVAVAEQPVQDLPVTPDTGAQAQITPETPVEVAGAQTIETPNGGGSITNIGQMTVPADAEVAPANSASPETAPVDQAPESMEGTSTEATGTETPEVDNDDSAATMLDPNSQSEHDVPASPYDMPATGDADSKETDSVGSDTPASVMPIETVEPDEAHTASTPGPEASEDDAIRTIVERPLTDDEREAVASDTDQMPVSPESSHSETLPEGTEDNKKTRAQETLNGMIEAIDLELKKLADKLKDYQAKQSKIETDIETTQAEIDTKNAEKDDFVASVSALNIRSGTDTQEPASDLEQAA